MTTMFNGKLFKGYRTRIVNLASLIVLVGGALTGTVENPETLRIIAVAVTVANLILRELTNTPAGKSA